MIKPARGYVLVEPQEAEDISAGGVLLPDRVKDMPQKGKILVVGDPIIHFEAGIFEGKITPQEVCQFEVGDTVIFKRFVDNKIKEEGKELLLVKFEDILGVYDK